MTLFTTANFAVFTDPFSSDPAFDVERARVREKLVWLHEQIYPRVRQAKFDLHPHWMSERLVTPYLVAPGSRQITSISLRYSKAETVVKLMKKMLGAEFGNWERNGMLSVQVLTDGVRVQFELPPEAAADGQNLVTKNAQSPSRKKELAQLFGALGRDYTLTLVDHRERGDEIAARTDVAVIRTNRLVKIDVLDAILGRYVPTQHEIKVSMKYGVDDPRLDKECVVDELLHRVTELYPLYYFWCWSPRNDFLSRSGDEPSESDV